MKAPIAAEDEHDAIVKKFFEDEHMRGGIRRNKRSKNKRSRSRSKQRSPPFRAWGSLKLHKAARRSKLAAARRLKSKSKSNSAARRSKRVRAR
jgi:hypothetical protein